MTDFIASILKYSVSPFGRLCVHERARLQAMCAQVQAFISAKAYVRFTLKQHFNTEENSKCLKRTSRRTRRTQRNGLDEIKGIELVRWVFFT